ncbi:MAG: peptidase C69 [Planctomycetes bacterium]|jgi:TldD protein|nr:peptidase C69 [Candidatus Woesearchaeota archaeon]MBJ77289.1 peptidase C69 [Planctomycetota bacterium]HJM57028.1 TldD/PmbA family protein [Planctomycetota bacterium]
MLDQAHQAVSEALKAGADYADVRINRLCQERYVVRDGSLEEAEAPEDFGIGVRVMKDGAWGFAAAPCAASEVGDAYPGLVRRAVKVAHDVAPSRREPLRLAAEDGHVGEYVTPIGQDPFAVGLKSKLDLLRSASDSMSGHDDTVARTASLSLRREEQWQASSEGAALHQVLVRSGAGMSCVSAANGTVERRSYPASFGGNYRSAGWEFVEGLNLCDHGERLRDESVALCHAPLCPEGEHTLILGGSQLMLQIHESVGHPNELDRVHGHEVDLAGRSFATTEKLGSYKYGSEYVNLVADSTVAGGLDTRGYDDECVRSGRWPVVEKGVFVGYHTSREWAHTIDEERSRGTARAEGWYSPPIIRMTNLSLEPGTWSFDDLVADTEDGAIFADTVRTWSIDQRRLNFQFTTEIGWEIQDGKLGKLVRRPTYQGRSPDFWRSCDAVCDESHWDLWGVPNCGKGNPMQTAEMSHGASPARFRGVRFLN